MWHKRWQMHCGIKLTPESLLRRSALLLQHKRSSSWQSDDLLSIQQLLSHHLDKLWWFPRIKLRLEIKQPGRLKMNNRLVSRGFESCCVFQTVVVFRPASRCDLHRLWWDDDLHGPDERHMKMMMRKGSFTILIEELWKEHIVPSVCGPESHSVFASRRLQSHFSPFSLNEQ